MHELAERILTHARKHDMFRAGDRVGVAVSGGSDSVALLRLMLEMRADAGVVVSVVHFNHKLRGNESDQDEQFVNELAQHLGLEYHAGRSDAASAKDSGLSGEAGARELRYEFFRRLLGSRADKVLDRVATAHTLDDQAETVLMRLIRGTGFRGLGGIYPRIEAEDQAEEVCGEIVRPLLEFRRVELQAYLTSLGQSWREDSSNQKLHFTRNRLRQLVMPVLQKEFNPSVAEVFSEFSDIARGEEEFWTNEVAGWMGTVVQWQQPEWARGGVRNSLVQLQPLQTELHGSVQKPAKGSLDAHVDLHWFSSEPIAVRRRVTRAIAQASELALTFRHVETILEFAESINSTGKEISLPLGWKVRRETGSLIFLAPRPNDPDKPTEYECRLMIPGRVEIPGTSTALIAIRTTMKASCMFDSDGDRTDALLDGDSVAHELTVRNWRPGDRYWPAHTKGPKKLKELLQDRNVTGLQKKQWPVVASGNDIVWVPGFLPPSRMQAKDGGNMVLLTIQNQKLI